MNGKYGNFPRDRQEQRPYHSGGRQESSAPTPPAVKFNDKDFKLIIVEEAEKAAGYIYNEYDTSKGRKMNRNSQIRRFYDELVHLQHNRQDFEKLLPAIYMIASKAAYAHGRELVGKYFYNYIKENVCAVKTADDLDKCIMYIEAVLGYYRKLNTKEN
jgi:CRISPR type III-A-associated protein Csm2